MPGGNAPLTPDQAIVLTQYLDDAHDDIERLHRVLTNIANAATFNESKFIEMKSFSKKTTSLRRSSKLS